MTPAEKAALVAELEGLIAGLERDVETPGPPVEPQEQGRANPVMTRELGPAEAPAADASGPCWAALPDVRLAFGGPRTAL